MWMCYLNVIECTSSRGGLQLEGCKGVVDGISTAGLDCPATLAVVRIVVGKVQ